MVVASFSLVLGQSRALALLPQTSYFLSDVWNLYNSFLQPHLTRRFTVFYTMSPSFVRPLLCVSFTELKLQKARQ